MHTFLLILSHNLHENLMSRHVEFTRFVMVIRDNVDDDGGGDVNDDNDNDDNDNDDNGKLIVEIRHVPFIMDELLVSID